MPIRSRTEPGRLDSAGSRTEPTRQLTETQWFLIEDLFPDPTANPHGGRPFRKNRDCFEGILFVLVTGCRWKDLPKHFPSKSVCHQRFQLWVELGLFEEAWQRLLELRNDLKQLDLSRLLADATFVPAKKRGLDIGPTKAGKGSKVCLLTDSNGTPLGVSVSSASPHDVTLIESLLDASQQKMPRESRLVYDRAADSRSLRTRLQERGVRLICPFIQRRYQKPRRMGKRDRRHYAHRWKIERTFAWLKNLRRLTTRWEYLPHLHEGFWQLACLFTRLQQL